ncbi:hypothetical protein H4Q26_001088 [Puccinia striiformis f. sp. tritici PST-130]|nr:hypothetical protein H4Q26_001088 [Puccinia striiformis f. sp. tritici PST-130]
MPSDRSYPSVAGRLNGRLYEDNGSQQLLVDTVDETIEGDAERLIWDILTTTARSDWTDGNASRCDAGRARAPSRKESLLRFARGMGLPFGLILRAESEGCFRAPKIIHPLHAFPHLCDCFLSAGGLAAAFNKKFQFGCPPERPHGLCASKKQSGQWSEAAWIDFSFSGGILSRSDESNE